MWWYYPTNKAILRIVCDVLDPPPAPPIWGWGGARYLFFSGGNSSGIQKKFTKHYVVNRYFASIFKLKKTAVRPHKQGDSQDIMWSFGAPPAPLIGG